MTEQSARAAIDAILERDRLQLMPEEYERLIGLYAELRSQVDDLWAPEFLASEPAVIYRAAG
jgi:hypothetical protein